MTLVIIAFFAGAMLGYLACALMVISDECNEGEES